MPDTIPTPPTRAERPSPATRLAGCIPLFADVPDADAGPARHLAAHRHDRHGRCCSSSSLIPLLNGRRRRARLQAQLPGQVPLLRRRRPRDRPDLGLHRPALALPGAVLLPRRVRDGHAPEPPAGRRRRAAGVQQHPAVHVLQQRARAAVRSGGRSRRCRSRSWPASFLPALAAALFGFFIFRSRVRGVYFSIITQAVAWGAWLLISRNEMLLGGTNGLTNFYKPLTADAHVDHRAVPADADSRWCSAYLLCRAIVRSRLGRVLVAVRDKETRLYFAATGRTRSRSSPSRSARCWPASAGCSTRRRWHHHAAEHERRGVDPHGDLGGRRRPRQAVGRDLRRAAGQRTLQSSLTLRSARRLAVRPGRRCSSASCCSSPTASSASGTQLERQITSGDAYSHGRSRPLPLVALALFVLAEALGLMPRSFAHVAFTSRGSATCSCKYLVLLVLLAASGVYYGSSTQAAAATAARIARLCRSPPGGEGGRRMTATPSHPRRSQSTPRCRRTTHGLPARRHRQLRRLQGAGHQRRSPSTATSCASSSAPTAPARPRSATSSAARPASPPARSIFDGTDVTHMPDVEIARLGVGRKFQTPTVFDSLTVYENMELALPGRRGVLPQPLRPGDRRAARPRSSRSSSAST